MRKQQKKYVFPLDDGHGASLAHYVLFGADDESGSKGLARFSGTAQGPDAIRKEAQLSSAFVRTVQGKKKTAIMNSYKALYKGDISFADIGNVRKKDITATVAFLLRKKQFPIMLGGDHSLTYEVLKGVNDVYKNKKIALVYFDAHPDFLSSAQCTYASVIHHAIKLKAVSCKNTIQVGVRDIEPEEFKNKKSSSISWLSALDVQKMGIQDTLRKIKSKIGKLPVYISVDLDALDCVFAPGVSTPSPAGLTSRELIYFVSELARENIIGMDIMEHSPKKDIQHITARVAGRLLTEFVWRHATQSKVKSS